MPNNKLFMQKKYPKCNYFYLLIFLFFPVFSYSQAVGDYRSNGTGNWTVLSSWQYYNGTSWVTPTGISPQGYPGQYAGTGTVTIRNTHTITINTITPNNFTALIIGEGLSGILLIDEDITIKTQNVIINQYAILMFGKNNEVVFPVGTSLLINSPGKIDTDNNCSNNNAIYIGEVKFATCVGSGNAEYTFQQINDFGGTISAIINSISPVCQNSNINLNGDFAGAPGNTTPGGSISGVNYLWNILAPDNTIILGYNQNHEFFATQTGDYIATLTCTTYFGSSKFTNSTTIKITVNSTNISVWTGALDDVWNNPGNWRCSVLPTSLIDVIIPSVGVTKFPILSNDLTVNNIEIKDGASLKVINNGLTVAGVLTLNGKIDLEGESQLVQTTGSTFVGTGSIEIDQQGTGNSFRYNYWSSPVNSRGTKFTIDEVLRGGDGTGTLTNKNISYNASHTWAEGDVNSTPIRLSTYWMYVLRNSGAGYSAWFRVGNTGEIAVGEGYTMKGSNTSAAEQNYTFVGKPNNGIITLSLNANYNYLVGNPYPSAIDADQFLLDNATSITGAIYFWEHYGGDTHNLAGYQGGYATYNLGTGVPASSHPNVSSTGSSVKGAPKRYIPVAQAFFVVGDSDGGQIQFKNGQRKFIKESLGNSIFMKSSNTEAKTANKQGDDLRPKFRIGFDAPQISHRQLLLTIDDRASKEVDWGFDAEIYEVFPDDMYWMLNNKKYVIQGTNAVGLNSEIPLGIQLSKTGLVTVKIDALENVYDDTFIYLKDKITGESFNMREKPVQLNLVAGKYLDRFVLIFKTQKLVAEDVIAEVLTPVASQPVIEGIQVFMNKAIGELQIKNNSSDEIVGVALRNVLGQTVKMWNSNFKAKTISLPINITTGIYLVQINTKTGKTVKKISVE